MNSIVTDDDASASVIDDPKQFWRKVEDFLDEDVIGNEDEKSDLIRERLTYLYTLCDANYDIHLDYSQNIDYLLSQLFDSPIISNCSVDECASTLASLAISSKSLPQILLIYDTLLKLAHKYQSDLFKSHNSITKQLIPRLVHHFWAARYAEEYNEKQVKTPDVKQNDENSIDSLSDWNIVHVRSISSGGNAGRQRQLNEQRDRNILIKLRERSVRLLYEICRSQRLNLADMKSIDATFINHLFDLVETSRNFFDDTYNYQVIKLIVALNEQFMVSGISTMSDKKAPRKSTASASNIVLTVLRMRLNASKTFGENIIFMLNRGSNSDAEDICVQLLILKLLYLLFTTKETSHYFYTNDLKVLVDIFIRELSDLPDEHDSLRHTYLRVLHPLLTNTQLLTYPYKRNQIHRLLLGLTSHGHWRDVNPTTKRLIDRCLSAQWCVDLDRLDPSKSKITKGQEENNEREHTFAVQAIGGGPARLVHAPAVLDSEGISIPVGEDHKPILGSMGTNTMTAELLKTSEPVLLMEDSHSRSPTRTIETFGHDRDASTGGITPKMRTIRVHSVNDMPSDMRKALNEYDGKIHSETFSDTDSNSNSHSMIDTKSYDNQHSVQMPMTSKGQVKDLGTQYSKPKRVHSAIDVTKTRSEVESEDESPRWVGSPAESWHQGMVDEQPPTEESLVKTVLCGRPRAESISGNAVNTASPLRDSLSAHDIPNINVPLVTVQTISREVDDVNSNKEEDDNKGKTSNNNTSRRRPPAPPTLSDGRNTARQNQLRRLGIHHSPSESALVKPKSDTGVQEYKDHLSTSDAYYNNSYMNTVSSPTTPGESQAGSREVSRSGSPIPQTDNIALSTSGSSSVGRRRRPPPPPIDRSTKVGRSDLQNTQTESTNTSSSSDTYDESARVRRNDTVRQRMQGNSTSYSAPYYQTDHSTTAMPEQQQQSHDDSHLSQYMRHLHINDQGPYGW